MAKKRRRLNKTRFLIFLLVTASIIFGMVKFVQFVARGFGGNDIDLKRISTIEYLKTDKDDTEVDIESFNEHIVKFEQGKLSAYNKEGEILWEKELDINKPIIKGNKDNIVIADSFNGNVYIMDYSGEIKIRNNVDQKIMDIRLNDSGHVFAMLEKGIFVFKPDGETISNFNIPKGEIIDGDLCPDNSTIALNVLVAEEDKFYSNILFYSLEGKVLAGKKFDNKVINKIFLINNKNLLVLGNNSILMLTDENKILWEKKFDETLNRGLLNDNGLLILNLANKDNIIIDTKSKNTISQVDLNGNIINTTPIAGEILGLDVFDDIIGIFTDRTIYVIDKKGNTVLEKKINKDIKGIKWVSKEDFLVIYKDKLDIMKMDN